MSADDLEALALGELYECACHALRCTPQPDITRALSCEGGARRALIALIDAPRSAAKRQKSDGPCEEGEGVEAASTPPRPSEESAGGEAASPPPLLVEGQHAALEALWRSASASPAEEQVAPCLQLIAQASLCGEEARPFVDDARRQLDEALENLAARAPREEEEAAAVPHPLVQKRLLSRGGGGLTADESCRCLVHCIEYGASQARHAEGKKVVVVLGNTGAGKSAFINLLHGCSFELSPEGKMVVPRSSEVAELMKIGHSNASETFAPRVAEARSLGEGFAFADCPGFLDNRGFEINVANAVNVRQTLSAAASVLVVVIINFHSLLSDRGKGIKDLFHILSGLFGSIESVKRHAHSVLLAISQAPVAHPETGQPTTLAYLKARLLDPSGLDRTATEFLDAIVDANVISYHLLDRGPESWLRRPSIVARIQALPPIEQPSNLFQSVVGDADKESLRRLLKEMSEKATAAILASEYEVAASVLSSLLRINRVENDFVTALVDDAIDAVIDGRVAQLNALIHGGEEEAPPTEGEEGEEAPPPGGAADDLPPPGREEPPPAGAGGSVASARGEGAAAAPPGEEGGEAAAARSGLSLVAEARRFAEARSELRRLARLLAVCAPLRQVRSKLGAALVEAACALEAAVKRRSDAMARELVDAPLQAVLRGVGENVVREVLWVEEAAAAAAREEAAVRQAQLAEVRARGGEEWQAVVAQMAEYRRRAADGLWSAHAEGAREKLRAEDARRRREEAPAFWAKTGGGEEALREERGPVNWARRRVTDEDCEVVSTILRGLRGPPHLQVLLLSSNAIGDAGVAALADATAFGALANLEKLYMDNNRVGDVGMAALAASLGKGRLAKLAFVDLSCNRIRDHGVLALAEAIAAMENLATLYIYSNQIGDAGIAALVNALLASPTSLGKLSKLWLSENKIGARGMAALGDAIAKGVLLSLTSLRLDGNPATEETQRDVLQKLEKRDSMVATESASDATATRALDGMPGWWIA
ncbi:hypothetical protein AB1Y20_019893 [Prymnesium parvum]|uniref:G domain-containing protein n=1 Tax=Prymnesium parvum TaxID=97485 RepID=A0AB34JS78_PRYPA